MSDEILSIGLDPAPLQDGVQKAISALETVKRALSEFANTPADKMKAELEKVTSAAKTASASIAAAAKDLESGMARGASKGAQAMAKALKDEGDKAVSIVKAQRQQIQAEYEAMVSKGWKIKPPKLLELQQKGVQLAPDDRVSLLAYKDSFAAASAAYKVRVAEAGKAAAAERSFLNTIERDTQSTYNAIYRFKVAEAKKADREEQSFLEAVQRDTQATWNRIYQYKVSEAKKADREERSFLNAVQRDTQATYNAMYRYKVAEANRAEREIAANQAKNASFQAMTPQGQLARATRVNYALAGGMGEAEAVRRYGEASVAASKNLMLLRAAAQQAASESASLRNATRAARAGLDETGASAAGATKPLKDMSVSMNDLHSAARGVASGFNAMWLTWGNIAPLLAGAALSNAFVQSIKKGSEFMHTLTKIEVLAGESAESLGQLSDKALELGARGPFGPLQVVDALKTLALAGLNAKEQLEAIGTVRNFAMVGDMDLNTASERLVAIGTAYGYAAKDFSVVSDVIAKTAAASMASIDGMSESFKQASVVAQQYGVTLEDTSTTLALLSQIGIVGQSAGTAMRNMYTELMGSSKRARAVLEQTLKIDVWDNAAKAMKPLPVIMDDMLKALSRYDSKSQQAILATLGNERGTKALAANLGALMNKFNETGDAASNQFTRVREEIANAAGFTAQAAAVMATTSANQMKAVGSTLETTLIKAFQEAEPAVQALAVKLRDIFGSAEFQNAVTTLASATASFTESLVRNAETIATLVKLYLAYKASVIAAQMATLALGAATTVAATAQRTWAAITMVAQGLIAAMRGSASASMVLTSSLMTATGSATAAAGAMGLLQASLGPIAAILAAAGAAWYLFGSESEKAGTVGGRSMDTLNTSMEALMGSMDEEIKRLKAVQEQRDKGMIGAVAAAGVEKELAANKIRQIAEQKRQLLDLQREELKTAYASWEKYKGIPILGTVAEDAQTGIFSKLKDLEKSYKDVADSESAGLARVAELHTLAVANAKSAAKEIADSFRKRPTGPNKFNPDEVGVNQASKLKALRDNEIKELEKQYGLKLSVIQNATETEKQLLDKARSSEAISQGEFTAKELALVVSSEREQLDAIENNSAAVLDAYRRRREELQGLLSSAKGIKGGDAKVNQFSQEIENLDNSLASFNERVKGDKAKLENGVLARVKTQAIEAQGALRKLNEDAKEFARSEERLMEDRTLERELAAKLRGASEEQAAVLKAQFDEQKRLNEQVRAYTESIRKAEEALGDFWETSNALAKADPNWAGYTYEQMAAVKAMEDRIARLRQLRDEMSTSAVSKVSQAGSDALNEQMLDKRAELSKSIAGALVTGLTEGADKASDKLRDILVTELSKPITLYVQAVVQSIMGDFSNFLGLGGISGGAGAGSTSGGGGVGGIVSMASGASSAYKLLTNGVSESVQAGFSNLMSSSFGESLGLAQPVGYTTGSGVQYGLTQTGASVGSALGMAGNAMAGYAAHGLISNGYKIGSGKIMDAAALIGSAIFGPLAGVATGLVSRAFGRKLKDQGIEGTFGGADGFTGNTYQFYKGGWFRGDKTKRGDLDPGLQGALADQFHAAQVSTGLMATTLSLSTDAIKNFTADIKVSFRGLTEDQIAGKLQEEFGKIQESMAKAALGTDEYSRVGETSLQTLQRLSSAMTTVNGTLDTLGLTMYQVNLAGADMASQLTDKFGGLDAYTSATAAYYQAFYSDNERLQTSIRQTTKTVTDLGLAMPTTKDEFRELVEAQDLTTESGRNTYTALLKVAPAFAEVSDATKKLTSDLLKYIGDLKGNRAGLATPTQQLSAARQTYLTDLIAAKGGDQEAIGRVTSSAQSYIDAQKVVTASSTTTQAVIDQVIADLTGITSTVPHFASGGYHSGGWAMVGEEGPELAYFGSQARIYTAQQSSSMLSNDAVVAKLDALIEEVVQLRAQQNEETRAVINSNAAIQGRAAETIVSGVAAAGERQAWTQSTQPVIN